MTALCVPEAQGGAGWQVPVAVAAAAELGAALHGSPYAGSVAAARALAQAGEHDDVAAGVLSRVVSGEGLCVYGRTDGAGRAWVVDGLPEAEALVLEVPGGDLLLDTDPTSWSVVDEQGFDVSRLTAGVMVPAGSARRLGPDPMVGLLFDLLLAADAWGGVERAHARTVAYAGERQAFGRVIGGFQAVQHRLADHAVQLQGMGLLVQAAALAVAAGDADAHRRVLLAGASVSGTAVPLLHDLLQLTGAIGFTWEYGLHFFERRAHEDARMAGLPRRALLALADLEGWSDAG